MLLPIPHLRPLGVTAPELPFPVHVPHDAMTIQHHRTVLVLLPAIRGLVEYQVVKPGVENGVTSRHGRLKEFMDGILRRDALGPILPFHAHRLATTASESSRLGMASP